MQSLPFSRHTEILGAKPGLSHVGVGLPGIWEASRSSPQGVPSLPTPASSPPSWCPPKAEPGTDPPVPPPAARLGVASEQTLLSSAAPAPAPSWKPRPACHCHKWPEPVLQQPAGFIGCPGPPILLCTGHSLLTRPALTIFLLAVFVSHCGNELRPTKRFYGSFQFNCFSFLADTTFFKFEGIVSRSCLSFR